MRILTRRLGSRSRVSGVEGYKNVQVRDTDIAYIAGFIDGEGWIGISRSRAARSYRPSYSPKICVTSTKREILDWIRGKLQCGFVCKGKRIKTRNDKWNDSFMWAISSRAILQIAPLLMPYVHLKKRQLKIATQIARINLSLRAHPTGKRNSQSTEYTLAKLWTELKELNRRE